MDSDIKAALRIEFPDGEAWAWRWYWSSKALFWDRKGKRLTELSDRQILIVLLWVKYIALQFGVAPNFYGKETELLTVKFRLNFFLPVEPLRQTIGKRSAQKN